ncbi:PepSY domain-containing protein [Streptomyces sp. NBC_01298]|uniref:PepSY domain-containing protein n=1 Tax=Streptomyces sp. NBC_01298 TaxID=2903817 RepID=UPI002E129A12|nr:PepSY domain-containing protein [Streptomyces sp. NBC_01298]
MNVRTTVTAKSPAGAKGPAGAKSPAGAKGPAGAKAPTCAKAAAAVRRRRLPAAGLAAGALLLSLTACGGAGSDPGVDKARAAGNAAPAAAASTAPESPAATPEPATAEQGGPKTSRTQAMATAENSVPGGRITDVELETEDGTQVWEIDVMTAEPRVHHLTVDATTGALLGNRADRMPERARPYLEIPLATLAAASVDREDAVRTAVAAAGAGFVSELSIEGTEAGPLWRIEVSDGAVRHEIDIDAKTGEVARHQKEAKGEREQRQGRDRSADEDGGDSGDSGASGRPSQQEIRDRSGNLGQDHYDWSQHARR